MPTSPLVLTFWICLLASVLISCTSPSTPSEISEVEVTRQVPVEVTREVEVIREVPVEVTREVEVTRQVPVEVTREVEVIREVPVEVTREVEVTRTVPVTVIAQPTPVPVPAVQSFSGVGDDVVSCRLSSGNNIFEFTHSGRGHFAIWVYDSEGDRELLVNDSGRYEGANFVLAEEDGFELDPGSCILEITADGSWAAEIRTRP